MEINEALIKLEAHEKAQHGFDKIESHIIRGIGFLSFLMTAILGLAEYLR